MRPVALLLSITTLVGCFPHSARNRTFAKLGEGGAIAVGIALEAIANTGADCNQMTTPGQIPATCSTGSNAASDVGLALLLGGLIGFIATISTEVEDKAAPAIDIKADKAVDTSQLKLPPGVKPNTATQATGATPPSQTTAPAGAATR